MKLYFSQEKRSLYERYSKLIPKVFTEHDENKINKLNQCLTERRDHVVPLYNDSFIIVFAVLTWNIVRSSSCEMLWWKTNKVLLIFWYKMFCDHDLRKKNPKHWWNGCFRFPSWHLTEWIFWLYFLLTNYLLKLMLIVATSPLEELFFYY